MDKKPKVVFIGGIETGKTTTIESLWADNITDYQLSKGSLFLSVREMLAGREIVDFDVIELPRINYTSQNWIEKPNVSESIESADVITFVLGCDDLLINNRKIYIEKVFDSLHLKEDVVILVAFGMADWILNPISSQNLEINKSKQVSLNSVSNLIQKTNIVYSEFKSLKEYDSTFSVDSVIPYSNYLKWNIQTLKNQIWNGIVLALNNYVFDDNLPTVVLAGKTGCGKTSTINALWNLKLATGRVVSCTKFPAVLKISDEFNGQKICFNLVDLPGIAESMDANSIYRKFYYKFIAKASVLLCLSQADRRAYKQDQLFYEDLIDNGILTPNQNIILGINQADLLFKDEEHPDGIDLKGIRTNNPIVTEKVLDYYKCMAGVFSDFTKLTSDSVAIYSVMQNWNLNNLKYIIYNLF